MRSNGLSEVNANKQVEYFWLSARYYADRPRRWPLQRPLMSA